MSDLKAVRAHFALTQAELAGWLGLTRVRLSQAECGLRPLPLRAAAQLTQLTLALARAIAPPAEPPAPETPAPTEPPYLKPLLARERECRFQAKRLRVQLHALQARARPLEHRLAALPALLAALPPAEPRRRWLHRLFGGEAQDGLAAEVGAMPQALLAARIAAYEHEAERLAEWAAAHGG